MSWPCTVGFCMDAKALNRSKILLMSVYTFKHFFSDMPGQILKLGSSNLIQDYIHFDCYGWYSYCIICSSYSISEGINICTAQHHDDKLMLNVMFSTMLFAVPFFYAVLCFWKAQHRMCCCILNSDHVKILLKCEWQCIVCCT